ncbi:TPA: DUF1642 domain-containing protein [Streptococcus equi subsp. zooepidemicus]|nr:DUF1642 domain-containing protein [Streptococcus equi subsp. zooepidemicus]
MNINEVLYLPVKREGLNIGPDEFDCKCRYRTLDGEEVASSVKAKSKEELLDLPKPEVPRCVADFYKEKKHAFMYFYVRLIVDFYQNRTTKYNQSFIDWVRKTNEAYAILINMHQFGYTIEKEKLYTVEIPNPNREGRGHAKFVLERQGNKVFLVKRKSKDYYYNKNSNHLTEPEIRKDFDWAWREEFPKEVTE